MELLKYVFESNLFSLFLGSLLTFIFAFLLNKMNNNDIYNQNLIKKRIETYESLAKSMRKLNQYLDFKNTFPKKCKLKGIDGKPRLAFSIPIIFFNEHDFLQFMNEFMENFSKNRMWIDNDIAEELEFQIIQEIAGK